MDSLSLTFAVGFQGTAIGIPINSTIKALLSRRSQTNVTGSSKQVYDGYQVPLAASATVSINLLSGLTNPLNESITGANAFSTVYDVWIEHDISSLSTGGIRCFNGGSNEFQGPLNAASDATLVPGKYIAFGGPASVTGFTVSAGAKIIDIVNLDSVNPAIVNIFVNGTR